MQQMFPCPRCGAQNAIGQRFCGGCGNKLLYNCPYCSGIVDPSFASCPNCYAPLHWPTPPPPAPPSGPPAGGGAPPYQGQGRFYGYGAQKPKQQKPSSTPIIAIAAVAVVLIAVGALFALGILPPGETTPPTPPSTNGTPTPDITAPVITNVSASTTAVGAATITWSTNEPASSQVEYGIDTSYGSSSDLDSNLVTSHSVTLSSLAPDTVYHFRVISEDASGNETKSQSQTFTTLPSDDTTPPVISQVSDNTTASSSVISWITDEPADSQIEYGKTTDYGSMTTRDDEMVTSHSVTLDSLDSKTTYYYKVISKDASGNEATSEGQFTTIDPDDETPPVISLIIATPVDSEMVTIIWTTDELSSSQVEYGTTTDYGSTSTLDELKVSHFITLTGLTPSTTYHFRVISKDASGNEAISDDDTFSTPAS